MTTGFLDQPKYRRRVDKVEQISNRYLVALEDLDL